MPGARRSRERERERERSHARRMQGKHFVQAACGCAPSTLPALRLDRWRKPFYVSAPISMLKISRSPPPCHACLQTELSARACLARGGPRLSEPRLLDPAQIPQTWYRCIDIVAGADVVVNTWVSFENILQQLRATRACTTVLRTDTSSLENT